MTNAITVDSVLSLFQEEVADLGGRVTDKVCDERRLFVRSVLPEEAEVVRGDTVKAGVALRCANREIEIRPYVFRKVCRNGAIVAHSTMGRQIDVSLVADPASTLLEVRHAIRAAAAREAFVEFVHAMRESRGQAPDPDLMLMLMAGMPGADPSVLLNVMDRLRGRKTQDRFGFANLVTALARDTVDADLRWRREALGAAIFARLSTPLRQRERSGAPLQPV